jgi:hypothetical protein
MSENYSTKNKVKAPPVFMIILLILSGFSILQTLYQTGIPMASGAKSMEQLEQVEVELAKAKVELEAAGANNEFLGSLINMIDTAMIQQRYIHKHIFWRYHLIFFFSALLGALSLYFMYHLKKIGFHLYIIYSLIGIAATIFLFPEELRMSWVINFAIFSSVLFVGLYALNWKHFQAAEEARKGSGEINSYNN